MSESKSAVTFLPNSPVVLLKYEDILDPTKDLGAAIETAYGPNGLGILAVSGVPKFSETRQALLPLGWKFANLPEQIKEKYVHEKSSYCFGWSHGKEGFPNPDFAKGSYYANPLFDEPVSDPELVQKYITFAHPNIWPKEDLPELEHAMKDLGKLMVDTGALLAQHCDKFVKSKSPTYPDSRLAKIVRESRTPKARLLHYFPPEPKLNVHPAYRGVQVSSDSFKANWHHPAAVDPAVIPEHKADHDLGEGSWCGVHNDHGSLTALAPAMFFDITGKEIKNPDPNSGLYIRSRKGEIVKAVIPSDCLAFQIGETEQVHSGGILQATPHWVKGPDAVGAAKGCARVTYAVFMEPEWHELMNVPEGVDPGHAAEVSSAEYLPKGVPPLGSRWQNDYDFGVFTEKTVAAYLVPA